MLKTDEATVGAVARLIARARSVVMATGAGMSRESGIPTFRDALTGLWATSDPAELATEAGFRRNPARVFGWYTWRRHLIRAAVPHPGYHALVALERIVPELTIITQNVDGLHHRAGSARVLEVHGSLERFSCVDARHPFPADEIADSAEDSDRTPPPCHRCGAPVRPDVVWFGEVLPAAVTTAAWDAATRCDAMVVVGTSGLVWPAAQLPFVAREAGAAVIEINPVATAVSPAARIACRGPAGHVLPALVAALTETERGPT
jgi:NAD-dependent deacetylase